MMQEMNDPQKNIQYYPSGKIKSESYIINGKYHRLDGPAVIYYYESGQIKYENYCVNNYVKQQNIPIC